MNTIGLQIRCLIYLDHKRAGPVLSHRPLRLSTSVRSRSERDATPLFVLLEPLPEKQLGAEKV